MNIINADANQSDLQRSFNDFNIHTLDLIRNSTLLTYESNLQHLLALSGVLLIGRDVYDIKLDSYFVNTKIDDIRESAFKNVFKFDLAIENISHQIIIALITTIHQLYTNAITRATAVKSVMDLVTETMDPITIKLLLCFTQLISTLPRKNQAKKINEFELCSRYLQPVLQPLFDHDEDDMIFKWINTITFQENDDETEGTRNRPDGVVDNENKTIGFIEVKTIESAHNHKKINVDRNRLGIYGKTAISSMT